MFKNCRIHATQVSSDEYHAQKIERGHPAHIMSPSSIKAFMGNPRRWKGGYQPPDTEAKDYGNLLDCIVLTPSQFAERYAVRPDTYKDAKTGDEKPWTGNSNVCKAWLADHKGFNIVCSSDYYEAKEANARLLSDPTIEAFLQASQTQVHVVGEWHDNATSLVIPVQCLIDCVPDKESEFQKSLGDLKTTRNAGQRQFARWCYTAGYHVQAAFDLDIYRAATGEDRTDWIFLLSENYAPYETGRRLLSQDFLDIGRQTYQHALARYARCLKTGEWAGYDPDDEFSIISPEPYMAFESMSDAIESQQAEELADTEEIGITP